MGREQKRGGRTSCRERTKRKKERRLVEKRWQEMNTGEGRRIFQCQISRKELQRLMEVYSNMGAENTENMTQAPEGNKTK